MKRSLLLTALSLMLNIKAFSQSQCGLQAYYYIGNDAQTFTVVPVVYFQNRHNWYFEGRYNYEALNTVSAYAGKIFEKKAVVSYSVNPVIGMVMGEFKGGSAGINIRADYKKYTLSSQAQYTFSLLDKKENFTYSWSELAYNATSYIAGGLCLQHTQVYDTRNKYDKGIFIKMKISHWSFPMYVFEKPGNEKYFVLGLNYEWTGKSAFINRNSSININNLK